MLVNASKKINMIRFSILLFFVFLSFSVHSQDPVTFGDEIEPVHYFLGYRIIPTYSTPVQYALIYAPQGSAEEITLISRNTFVAYAKGLTKCEANPGKENFFEVYGIINETTVDELWKLRYKNYPFKLTSGNLDVGWSTNDSFPSMPSEEQLILLNQFGISKISDFCYGDNAFRLLKSLEKEDWVTMYKSAF
jgi:hypothetical protein